MKLSIQYLNDSKGKVKAVQLPLSDWKKVMQLFKKYQEELQIKGDLTKAFEEVKRIQKGELKSRSFTDFLKEL